MPEISMNEVKDLGSLGIKPETHMTDAEVKNLFDKIKQKFSDTIKEIKETEKYDGGRYGDLTKENHDGKELHHSPADSASPLEKNDGPAVVMDEADHRKTASCGNSKEAREYREKQKELIEQGKFEQAMRMDYKDLHSKFGNKYDAAFFKAYNYYKQEAKYYL